MPTTYTELQLMRLDGQPTTIRVEPAFSPADLQYHAHRRAVTLGNLTVLYHGVVYAVQPRGAAAAEA